MPLARITRQVKELEPAVLEMLDELLRAGPRAVAGKQGPRGPAPLVGIVRIVPDEVADWERSRTIEHGPQAPAVEHVAGGQFAVGGVQEGGGDVERAGRHPGSRAGLDHAGPADDARHPDAPLVHKPLAGPQRQVRGGRALGRGQAAVVAREHDERVGRLARPLHRREHRRHGLVHFADHAGVHGMVLHAPGKRIAGRSCRQVEPRADTGRSLALRGGELGPGDQGHVHRVHRHVAKPGAPGGCRLGDERRRLAGDRPGVERVIEWPGAGADRRRAGHVEAMLEDVLRWTQVPLAEDAGGVAGLFQEFGHGDLGFGESLEVVGPQELAPPVPRDVVRDPDPGRVAAGDQGRPGRRADGAGGVAPREHHPGGGQSIDRGRAVEAAAGAAEVAGPEIIGQEHEQVGPRPGRGCRLLRAARGRHGRRRGWFPPGIEARLQSGDDARLSGDEIPALARVGRHVEEFQLAPLIAGLILGGDVAALPRGERSAAAGRDRLDELPEVIALLADRPPPHQAPLGLLEIHDRVGVALPEELLPRRHCRLVEQVHTRQARRRRYATGREHGRQDVERAGEGLAPGWRDRARPPEHDRRPQAAVVGRELGAGGEPRAVGPLDPAVVGDVDHERVGREFFAVEKVEQVADRAVEPLDVAPVAGHVDALGLRRVVLDELLRRVVGVVGQHRGVPDEEGLVCCPAPPHEGLNRLQRLATDGQALVAVPLPLGHPLIEATPAKIPLPPLAGLEALVAVRPEELGQRGPGLELPVHPLAAGRKGCLAGR